jgi:hypothetical protein
MTYTVQFGKDKIYVLEKKLTWTFLTKKGIEWCGEDKLCGTLDTS